MKKENDAVFDDLLTPFLVVKYISPEKASTKQLLAWTRSYWGIENSLHYRREVTLNEDSTRMSNGVLEETMTVLNNFALGLVSKLGICNLASAQWMFDAKITIYLASYGQ